LSFPSERNILLLNLSGIRFRHIYSGLRITKTVSNTSAQHARAVVFKLFHAATHFATQFNLTTPSEYFQSGICNAVVFAQ